VVAAPTFAPAIDRRAPAVSLFRPGVRASCLPGPERCARASRPPSDHGQSPDAVGTSNPTVLPAEPDRASSDLAGIEAGVPFSTILVHAPPAAGVNAGWVGCEAVSITTTQVIVTTQDFRRVGPVLAPARVLQSAVEAWRNQPAVRSDASHAEYRSLVVEFSQVIPRMSAAENVSTFEWRGLHLHAVTSEPPSPDQVRDIKRSLAKVSSVGQAADILGMILGRSVRSRTERPSLDVRLEVGR
jgi:hypothetical protein